MTSPPNECRKNAEVCLGMAERIPNPPDKEMWVRLANSWLKLARLEEEAEARRSEGFHPFGALAEPAKPPPVPAPLRPEAKLARSARTKKRKAG